MKLRQVTALSLMAGLLVLALAGCSDGKLARGYAKVYPEKAAATSSPERRIAVSHAFELLFPRAEIEAVQQAHLAECAKLKCVVLETSINRYSFVNATSELRMTPEAFDAFMKVIANSSAKMSSHRETREDKTIAFRDAEKHLDVKTLLRDRLLAMLKDPAHKSAADLAAIEKELAQVQGDIEKAITERDYLKTITETVKVSLTYRDTSHDVGGFDLTPLEDAVASVGQTLINSLAIFISFAVALVPWVPFLALVAWAGRRGYRRWKRPQT